MMARVLVGLSGGVDSSAVVAKIFERGDEPVAVTLVMQHGAWPVPDPAAVERARSVAEQLGVEHRVLDVSERFFSTVVEPFADEYARGRTPNPCVVCNSDVKFACLVELADELDCPTVATGHYARLVSSGEDTLVARSADADKDQSYFLYRVPPKILNRLEFPLAEILKSDTRAFAKGLGLSSAEAKDSTGVCFAPGGDYRRLLAERRPDLLVAGDIVDGDGRLLGRHGGVARYTVGQRKGLGLSGGPWFVSRLDADNNLVVVEHDVEPLRSSFALRGTLTWGWAAGESHAMLSVQTRYHAAPLPAHVTFDGTRARVELLDGATYAAEGQSCVLYDGDAVMGGGFISWT